MELLMLCHIFPQRGKEDFRAKNAQVLCRLQSSLANANISGFYLFFFEPNPSAPSFYLRSAHSSSTTLVRDIRTKKTSKPRIRAETLDDGEDVEEVVHHQGLSYVLEIIRNKLTSHYGIEKT